MRWGWLNGWLLLSALFLVFGLLLTGFSRDIVAKLYDVSGWSRHQRVVAALGKLPALACFVLFIGTPLKIGQGLLVVGVALCVVGIVVMSAALQTYNRTPSGEMVTRGLYRVSRNPQWLGMAAMLLGTCVRDRFVDRGHILVGVGGRVSLPPARRRDRLSGTVRDGVWGLHGAGATIPVLLRMERSVRPSPSGETRFVRPGAAAYDQPFLGPWSE